MAGLCVTLQSCSGTSDTTGYGSEREQSFYSTVSSSDIELINDLSHTKGSHLSFQTQSILRKQVGTHHVTLHSFFYSLIL